MELEIGCAKVVIGISRQSMSLECGSDSHQWWATNGVIENIGGKESWGELVKIIDSTPQIFKVGGPNIEFVIFTNSTQLILVSQIPPTFLCCVINFMLVFLKNRDIF